MKLLFVLATLVGTAFAGIVDCGVNPLFTITTLSQSPDTVVKPGDNTTLTLKYKVPEEVTGGTTTTSLSLNGLPLTPSIEDLCTKVSCPILPGEHDGSSWTTFPSGVSGKIVSKVVWTDTNGKELLCIKSTFQASAENSENNGQINLLEGITTAKPEKSLVLYIPPPIEETSSSSSDSGSNSAATGSSSSGSGSITVKNLRGAK